MESRERKKAIIAGVLLVTAGIVGFYSLRSDSDLTAQDIASETQWYCVSCNKPFVLTGAELEDSVRMVERSVDGAEQTEASGPQARGRGTRQMFKVATCPTCKQLTGEAARKCDSCGEVFLARTKKGATAICPKCHWDPHTGHPAEGDRLTEGVDE